MVVTVEFWGESMGVAQFKERVLGVLFPEFCEYRQDIDYSFDSLIARWDDFHDNDVDDCILAIDNMIVVDRGGGVYINERSGSIDLLFHSGMKSISPRPLTLLPEPIITFAVLYRLYAELGWPRGNLGLQSPHPFAFDAMAYASSTDQMGFIACEIKATKAAIDRMMTKMVTYGSDPTTPKPQVDPNAFNKVVELRKRQPRYFWAVGPNRYSLVYEMHYSSEGEVSFKRVHDACLRYPGPSSAS